MYLCVSHDIRVWDQYADGMQCYHSTGANFYDLPFPKYAPPLYNVIATFIRDHKLEQCPYFVAKKEPILL